MNLKGYGRKWPDLTYYPWMDGLRKNIKTIKILNQYSRFPGRDFKHGPLEYEAEVLVIWP
jgi:hypothetical protein